MDVRGLALRRCALVVVSLLAMTSGCRWVRFILEDEEPPPRDPSLGPSMAQLWEDGYGFNNPNGEAIRSGKKKPGDKPSKNNPYYESDRDDRRRSAAAKEKVQFVEPTFDLD